MIHKNNLLEEDIYNGVSEPHREKTEKIKIKKLSGKFKYYENEVENGVE